MFADVPTLAARPVATAAANSLDEQVDRDAITNRVDALREVKKDNGLAWSSEEERDQCFKLAGLGVPNRLRTALGR